MRLSSKSGWSSSSSCNVIVVDSSWVGDDSGWFSFEGRRSGRVSHTPAGHAGSDSRTADKSRGGMAETSGRKEVNVVALGRDNYSRWRIEVETALRGQGLYWHASGAEPRIEEPAPLAAAATAEQRTEHEAAVKSYRAWDEKDSKARTVIMRTLDDITFSHVADCTSSKAILDRICELRDPKTTDVLMTGLTAFFDEKWQEDDDVSSFMARLAVHASRVNGCKSDTVTIADQFIMAKTLTSLPPVFAHFVQSWHLVAKADSSLSSFREKVLSAERSMVDVQSSFGASGDALHASRSTMRDRRPQNRRAGPAGKSKADSECHYCHKRGHWKAECRKRIEEEKNGKKEDDGTACAATAINIALSAYTVFSSTTIIADSGASQHLTGNRSWFKSLRKLDVPLKFQSADGEIVAHHVGDIADVARRCLHPVTQCVFVLDNVPGVERLRIPTRRRPHVHHKGRKAVHRWQSKRAVIQAIHSGSRTDWDCTGHADDWRLASKTRPRSGRHGAGDG